MRPQAVPEADRIGVEELIGAHLDKGGGKAGEVPKQGGEQGGGQVGVPGVGLAHRPDIVHGEHGVQVGSFGVGLPAGRHVGPGGEEHQPAGQPPAHLPQAQAEHQGQVAPGAVPGHHDVPGAVAQVHQVVPGLDRVLHRGGEGVLRGQAVLEGEHLPPRHIGQLGRQGTGVAQVAAGVPPAVAVEHGPAAVVAPVGPDPGRRGALQVEGIPAQALHGGGQAAQHLLCPPLPLQVLRAHGVVGGGGVEDLQGPHQRVQAAALGGRLLLRRAAEQLHPPVRLFRFHGRPPCGIVWNLPQYTTPRREKKGEEGNEPLFASLPLVGRGKTW